MTETVQQLLPTLLALSESERGMIVDVLNESLPFDDAVDPEFLAMLNRRWDDIKSGRDLGISGDEVMAEARKKFQ